MSVDCDSAADGPLYYFDRDSLDVVATCGGSCAVLENVEACQANCPPAGWTCTD